MQPPATALVNNYLRDFKVIQSKAGTKRGSIHDIRKTFGTRMAQHVKIQELKELMGHASITTTADFYVDVTEDMAAKVATAFAS